MKKKKNEKEEEPLDAGDARSAVSSSSRTRGGRSARLWPMIMLLTRRQQNKRGSSEVVIHNRYSASFPIGFCQIHTHTVRRGLLKASTNTHLTPAQMKYASFSILASARPTEDNLHHSTLRQRIRTRGGCKQTQATSRRNPTCIPTRGDLCKNSQNKRDFLYLIEERWLGGEDSLSHRKRSVADCDARSADLIGERLPDTRRKKENTRPPARLAPSRAERREKKKRQTEASSPDVEVFQARHYNTQQHAKFMQA